MSEQERLSPAELLQIEVTQWSELFVAKKHVTDLETLASSIIGKLSSVLNTPPDKVSISRECAEAAYQSLRDDLMFDDVTLFEELAQALGENQ